MTLRAAFKIDLPAQYLGRLRTRGPHRWLAHGDERQPAGSSSSASGQATKSSGEVGGRRPLANGQRPRDVPEVHREPRDRADDRGCRGRPDRPHRPSPPTTPCGTGSRSRTRRDRRTSRCRACRAFNPAVATATAAATQAYRRRGACAPPARSPQAPATSPTARRRRRPGDPQLDVTWGSTGAPTMPAGSSVTFSRRTTRPRRTRPRPRRPPRSMPHPVRRSRS